MNTTNTSADTPAIAIAAKQIIRDDVADPVDPGTVALARLLGCPPAGLVGHGSLAPIAMLAKE